MYIHVGNSLYGKVDQVPGLFHVATRFWHVNFFPLIPLKSFVILEGVKKSGDDDPPGAPVSLSYKSIFFAWLRCSLWLGAIAGLFVTIAGVVGAMERGQHVALVCLGLSGLPLICLALLYGTYRITRAGPLRALQLARLVNVSPEELAAHYVDKNLASLERLGETAEDAYDSR